MLHCEHGSGFPANCCLFFPLAPSTNAQRSFLPPPPPNQHNRLQNSDGLVLADSSLPGPRLGADAMGIRHTKGCACKKSGCLKKYCECFQAGIYCTDVCKCHDCKNFDVRGCKGGWGLRRKGFGWRMRRDCGASRALEQPAFVIARQQVRTQCYVPS